MMMRQVAIILDIVVVWVTIESHKRELSTPTFDDNGDVFCKGVNPELLISFLTKNPCHIDTFFSLLLNQHHSRLI